MQRQRGEIAHQLAVVAGASARSLLRVADPGPPGVLPTLTRLRVIVSTAQLGLLLFFFWFLFIWLLWLFFFTAAAAAAATAAAAAAAVAVVVVAAVVVVVVVPAVLVVVVVSAAHLPVHMDVARSR